MNEWINEWNILNKKPFTLNLIVGSNTFKEFFTWQSFKNCIHIFLINQSHDHSISWICRVKTRIKLARSPFTLDTGLSDEYIHVFALFVALAIVRYCVRYWQVYSREKKILDIWAIRPILTFHQIKKLTATVIIHQLGSHIVKGHFHLVMPTAE